MSREEEQIFSSVEPIVKKIKGLARSLSSEIPPYYGYFSSWHETLDEEYAEILQEYVNSGEIEKFAVSVYRDVGIIVVKFPNIDTKLKYVVKLKGVPWWE